MAVTLLHGPFSISMFFEARLFVPAVVLFSLVIGLGFVTRYGPLGFLLIIQSIACLGRPHCRSIACGSEAGAMGGRLDAATFCRSMASVAAGASSAPLSRYRLTEGTWWQLHRRSIDASISLGIAIGMVVRVYVTT